MALNPIPILRLVQGLLAVIILGLVSYVVVWALCLLFDRLELDKKLLQRGNQANFMVWNCVWTFLALLYLSFSHTYLPNIHHKYVVLAIEAITVLFWFAGFIALAVFVDDPFITACTTGSVNDPICGSAKAAIAFGAFEWLAWSGTLAHVIRAILNYNNSPVEGMPTVGTDGIAGSNSYLIDGFGHRSSHQKQQYKRPHSGEFAGQSLYVLQADPRHQQPQNMRPAPPLQMPEPAAYGASDPTQIV